MKKRYIFVVLSIAILCMGFTNKLISIAPGIYPVKQKTLTFFDLVTKDIDLAGNPAELTDSKPENIILDPEIHIENPKYGSFLFGNNNHRIWFVMGKDANGYWSDFYVDQTLDNQITVKEKVKGFESSDSKYKGFKNRQTFGLIPVPIKVSYQGTIGEFTEKLFVFFSINEIGNGPEAANDIIVEAFDASFMEGTVSFEAGKENRSIGFRIIDADSNGCFNDFGKDQLFLDLNDNGIFKKNEAFKMSEFFDKNPGGNKKAQFHLVVKPFPVKIAVLKALEEYDPTQMEPSSVTDKETVIKPGNVNN